MSNDIFKQWWGNLHGINLTYIMQDLRDVLSVINANISEHCLHHCGIMTTCAFVNIYSGNNLVAWWKQVTTWMDVDSQDVHR